MSETCPELIITENERGDRIKRACGRKLFEGSDRCIFHDSEAWITQAELMRKKTREKIENGDLNFQKYHLPEMDFSAITNEFRTPADFRGAVFHGNVDFSNMRFLSRVDFSNCIFSGNAFFLNTEFLGEYAAFGGAKFLGNAAFAGVKISGHAGFPDAQFSSTAFFRDNEFSGSAYFIDAKFLGEADFALSRFHEIAAFTGVTVSDIDFDFNNTLFERGIIVDEDSWSENGFRLSMEQSDLVTAASSYQALKRGFENIGHYRVAGELYYREMTCRKNMISFRSNMHSLRRGIFSRVKAIVHSSLARFPKRLRCPFQIVLKCKYLRQIFRKQILPKGQVGVTWRTLFDWLWKRVFDLTCGFGERPKRVFLWCMFIVFIFMGLYFPIVDASNLFSRLKTALLLSLDAFTPGKFLNIPFTSPGEWYVQIETVIGWFMLSLVLLVFTRKMSRG